MKYSDDKEGNVSETMSRRQINTKRKVTTKYENADGQ